MSEIKSIVVGNTTEAVIRLLFEHRIAEESTDLELNSASRALKIKDLKTKVLSFIRRNPNGQFELIAPEFKSEKLIKLTFNNFTSEDLEEDEKLSRYLFVIDDNFVEAKVTNKVTVGRDIVLTLKGE